jgi:hypothetical protein
MSLKQTLKRFLNQNALYWAPSGVTDDFGKMILLDPVQIRCRWEDKTERVLTKKGNEITSRAQVFADRDVKEEGVLWLSPGPKNSSAFSYATIVDDAAGNPDPFVNDGAWEIQQVGKQPDRKAKSFLRWAWL